MKSVVCFVLVIFSSHLFVHKLCHYIFVYSEVIDARSENANGQWTMSL